jgi:hypothetical protein
MADHNDLRVIPLICSACGASLRVTGIDAVYLCDGCRCAWEVNGDALVQREILHMSGAGEIRLPFWLFPFKVTTPEGEASTLADYLALTGSIQRPPPTEAARPPLVFVPAFSSLPLPQLVRAGRFITLRAPAIVLAKELREPVDPIVFSAVDAANMAEPVVVATLAEERRSSPRFLEAFSLRLGRGRLFTIPFIRRNSNCYQPDMNIEL